MLLLSKKYFILIIKYLNLHSLKIVQIHQLMNKILFFIFISAFFLSCSPFQKALKSEDLEVKYTEATRLYDLGKYSKALRLFDQLASEYKGKPQAEKMFYMYSKSLYAIKDYMLAGYQFEKYVSSYPKSEKVEEAAFLGAKSYSELSPVFSLDQVDTDKAVDKLQNFIDAYPESQYLAEANSKMKILREKLERKSYENAKLYNSISDHKSAIVALDNFVIDFPGTNLKEKALFYKFDSTYKLAINSVYNKMEERLKTSKIAYANLIKFKADSEYKNQADEMLARLDKDLQQFSK